MKPVAQKHSPSSRVLLSVAVVAFTLLSGCDLGTYAARQNEAAQSYQPPAMDAEPADSEEMKKPKPDRGE